MSESELSASRARVRHEHANRLSKESPGACLDREFHVVGMPDACVCKHMKVSRNLPEILRSCERMMNIIAREWHKVPAGFAKSTQAPTPPRASVP